MKASQTSNSYTVELASLKLDKLCRAIVKTNRDSFWGVASNWQLYTAMNPAGVSFAEFTRIVGSQRFLQALQDQRKSNYDALLINNLTL